MKPSDAKRSIIIEEAHTALFESVTDEQAGQMVKAMIAYQAGKEFKADDPLMIGILEMLYRSVDQNNADYDRRSEANRKAAQARWGSADASERMQSDANACERMQAHANDADRIGLDRITAPKVPSKKKARFSPPSVEEVAEYVRQRKSQVDPEAFVDFYASKGWKVGNQTMKDWKAAVRTWEKRVDKPQAPPGKIHFAGERSTDWGAMERTLIAAQHG